jgi:hypothetical protein
MAFKDWERSRTKSYSTSYINVSAISLEICLDRTYVQGYRKVDMLLWLRHGTTAKG